MEQEAHGQTHANSLFEKINNHNLIKCQQRPSGYINAITGGPMAKFVDCITTFHYIIQKYF